MLVYSSPALLPNFSTWTNLLVLSVHAGGVHRDNADDCASVAHVGVDVYVSPPGVASRHDRDGDARHAYVRVHARCFHDCVRAYVARSDATRLQSPLVIRRLPIWHSATRPIAVQPILRRRTVLPRNRPLFWPFRDVAIQAQIEQG